MSVDVFCGEQLFLNAIVYLGKHFLVRFTTDRLVFEKCLKAFSCQLGDKMALRPMSVCDCKEMVFGGQL